MNTMHNPFEIIVRKLESMETAMLELKEKLNKIEEYSPREAPIKTDQPATRQQAAKHLGVSVGTIDNLVKSKQLKHFRLGASVRFTYDDLDAFIEKKKACII